MTICINSGRPDSGPGGFFVPGVLRLPAVKAMPISFLLTAVLAVLVWQVPHHSRAGRLHRRRHYFIYHFMDYFWRDSAA
jgi:hypothetical protein